MAKLVLTTYWRSSCSYRVRIALAFKKLAYEAAFVNLLEGEQKKPDHVATNPIGHVPVLHIDGVAYVESVAILELIEDLYPEPPLLPKAPHARARVRELVQTVNAGIQPLQNLSVLERVGDAKLNHDERVAWMKHFIARGLAAFEGLVTRGEKEGVTGPFSYGSTFTMADAFLVPQLYAARRVGVDLAPFPRLVRADAAASELPFVVAARPEAQADAKP
jgi:maleylacetoacetate isomerase